MFSLVLLFLFYSLFSFFHFISFVTGRTKKTCLPSLVLIYLSIARSHIQLDPVGHYRRTTMSVSPPRPCLKQTPSSHPILPLLQVLPHLLPPHFQKSTPPSLPLHIILTHFFSIFFLSSVAPYFYTIATVCVLLITPITSSLQFSSIS